MKEIELKEAGKISRLTNKTFQFDPRIGEGYWSANYFLKSREIAEKHLAGHIVKEQWAFSPNSAAASALTTLCSAKVGTISAISEASNP